MSKDKLFESRILKNIMVIMQAIKVYILKKNNNAINGNIALASTPPHILAVLPVLHHDIILNVQDYKTKVKFYS